MITGQHNSRSEKVLSNVILSLLVRGGGIVVTLMLVPLTINYINKTDYGIWLTISSVVNWLAFFDIGLGNGLRNKVAEAAALNDYNLAKKYICSTYWVMSIISLIIACCFYFVNKFINWQNFLNITTQSNERLQTIMLFMVWTFCVLFVLRILNSILTAIHKTALSGFISFLGQAGVLVGVVFLRLFVKPDLLTLTIILNVIPVLILLIASAYLYATKLSYLRPEISNFDKKQFKDILNLGGAFFIVQIGALVLFQTDNFIISKVIGPGAVTEFNVSFKLFSIISMASFIILTPYWSAYTDAWTRKDFSWMQKNLIVIRKIWIVTSIVAIIIYVLSPFLYHLWVGDTVKISRAVSFANLIYVIVLCFQASHNYVINGIGKIRVQVYLMIISAILNIPLSFLLGHLYGVPGIVYSNVVFMALLSIVFYFQLKVLLFKRPQGGFNE